MSLVPSRTVDRPPRERDSIQLRLARLRREERASQPRAAPLAITSSPAFSTASPTWRKLVGPPAPPSWCKPVDERRFVDVKARTKWLERRQMLLSTFDEPKMGVDQASGRREVPSLGEVLRRKILEDLARPAKQSLYLPLVYLLPRHMRLAMFDTAALWHPLKERAILQLLREDDAWGSDGEGSDGESLEAEQDGFPDAPEESADLEDWVLDDDTAADDAEWERRYHEQTFDSLGANLTTLNLSFSPITLKGLRSLLLHDTPTRPLPSLPHLAVLQLAATPNIPLSQPFFETLRPLIQLRQLSIAGKAVDAPTAVPTAVLLSRLAAATPTLVVLDLSFLPLGGELDRRLSEVDWDVRWRELRKLGVRMGDKMPAERERRRKALWAAVTSRSRDRPRPWIDIIT